MHNGLAAVNCPQNAKVVSFSPHTVTLDHEVTMAGSKNIKSTYIDVEPLTRSSFSVFGSVIENPTGSRARSGHAFDVSCPEGVSANQGTARKYSEISPTIDLYGSSPSQRQSKTITTLFVCLPRQLRLVVETATEVCAVFDLKIMERHPYTTQTFTPLGLDPNDMTTAYIVVVAPTIPLSDPGAGTPDTANIKAFLARGSQAVTYGAGTWHAPMIVVGKREISFVVTQHVNGVANDDCQEIELNASVDGVFSIAIPDIGQVLRERRSKF